MQIHRFKIDIIFLIRYNCKKITKNERMKDMLLQFNVSNFMSIKDEVETIEMKAESAEIKAIAAKILEQL